MHLWDTGHHQHGGLWVENHRRSPSSEDYLVVLNPSVVWRLMSWRMWFLPLLFFDLETLSAQKLIEADIVHDQALFDSYRSRGVHSAGK